ncbi:unnamed protein product [marine sediment metagenome]|uniref:Protein kinase domain-containing protein n=1 Tax=marine sediment metagenome TaxID=412755 RepID=X0SIC7_9ZZZZ
MIRLKIDIEVLKKLERSIDIYNPEKGEVPIKVLGFGEISLVFELLSDVEPIAYKRIPIFDNEKQVNRHILAYNEYNRILDQEVGLNLPKYDVAWFKDDEDKIQFYCVQEKISPESVGNRVIHQINDEDINTLIVLVMREMKKVWEYSKNHETIDLGLDGQISNFMLIGYDPDNPNIDMNTKLTYIDTSTPMFRKNGVEAMDGELFLKSTPSFLRFFVKAAFLDEVIDRYYDWRLVTIDLIANFFKEQRPELIPGIIRQVNKFFKEEASEFNIEPITFEEVQKYYKNDKMIWVIFQNARKIDRFLKTKLFKKKYDFYLPDKIKR